MIKLHALLESAVSQLLVNAVARKELAEVFASLEMSNTKTGKLAFVKALELLPKAHLDFIRLLSELRNQLVHRVKNVSFDLTGHFLRERENRDARKLADKWGFGLRDGDKPSEPVARYHFQVKGQMKDQPSEALQTRETIFFLIPKYVILFSAMAILDAISMSNRYGAHIWTFLVECEDRAAFIKKAEDIFAKAKVGNPYHPFEVKEILERHNPDVRVKLDDDGQPILESLAGAFYIAYQCGSSADRLFDLLTKLKKFGI